MTWSSSMLAAARDLLVPPRCVGCGAPGAWLCTSCRALLDPLTLPGDLVIRGAGAHAGPLRDAIHRLKYRGERGLTDDLGALVATVVAKDVAEGERLDALVPLALHRARLLERGFDQAALLASAIGRRTGLPVIPALHRIRRGTAQVLLDRAARAANVKGAFVAEAHALRGLRVALVDDVATTGATLRDAAAAARAAGARVACGYVVAVDE